MNEIATKFIGAWSIFIKDHISNGWKEAYLDNTKWTKFILGTKQSKINTGSPLGDAILGHFGKSAFRYRKEDGLFDLTVAPTQSFHGVKSQHEVEKARTPVIDNQSYYPPYYDILIEVENNVETCWEEMTKLTYAKSKLKVLITYNWDVEPDQDYHYVSEILINNFSEIIKQSNAEFPENEETQYMLIVFQKKEDQLYWNSGVFKNKDGELINKQEEHVV